MGAWDAAAAAVALSAPCLLPCRREKMKRQKMEKNGHLSFGLGWWSPARAACSAAQPLAVECPAMQSPACLLCCDRGSSWPRQTSSFLCFYLFFILNLFSAARACPNHSKTCPALGPPWCLRRWAGSRKRHASGSHLFAHRPGRLSARQCLLGGEWSPPSIPRSGQSLLVCGGCRVLARTRHGGSEA